MKHVVYAEFADREAAAAALRDLAQAGVRESRAEVTIHEGRPTDNDQRPMSETDAPHAIAFGWLIGAALGAFVGWLVAGPLNLFALPTWIAVLCGGALGLLIGFIAGAILGPMNPNKQLDRLERHAARTGGIIATVEVMGHDQEESVQQVFARHGARQVQRKML